MEKLKNLFIKDEQGQVGIGTLIIFIAMVLVAAVAAAVLIQTSGNLQQRAQSTGQEATAEVSSNIKIDSIHGLRGNHIPSVNNPDNLTSNIQAIEIIAGVGAGAQKMDVNELVITVSDGNNENILRYNSSESLVDTLNKSRTIYTTNAIRDEDSTFTSSTPVMNRGDLIEFNISTFKEVSSDSLMYDGTGTADSNHNMSVNGVEISTNDTKEDMAWKNYSTTSEIQKIPTDSELELIPRTDLSITMTPEKGTSKSLSFTTPPSYGVDERIYLYP